MSNFHHCSPHHHHGHGVVVVETPGIQGPVGPKGEDGVTPEITAEAYTRQEGISVAKVVVGGTKEKPHFVFGIPRGEKGEDGITPTITAEAYALEEGAKDVVVRVSGTQTHPHFIFGIPRGEKGETGDAADLPRVSTSDIDKLF